MITLVSSKFLMAVVVLSQLRSEMIFWRDADVLESASVDVIEQGYMVYPHRKLCVLSRACASCEECDPS